MADSNLVVLDTNVISEAIRATPDERVLAFLEEHDLSTRITTITRAELRYGVARLPRGRRRSELHAAIETILSAYDDAFPFDSAAADAYGDVVSHRSGSGNPISTLDAQIAAACIARNACLATRNTGDFTGTGTEMVNPWEQNA